jgi:ferredoxin
MAHKIVADECTGCAACEDVCPSHAISQKGAVFVINPVKCTDCVGKYDTSQCVEACEPGCIFPV